MRVAAAAYPLDRLESPEALQAKLAAWVATAEADILVFPEYAAMELAAFGDASLEGAAATVTAGLPAYDAHLAALAEAHAVHICAGSAPVWDGARLVNRARWITPSGQVLTRDKHILTPWERTWGVQPGPAPAPVPGPTGPVGLLICYDAEFPTLPAPRVRWIFCWSPPQPRASAAPPGSRLPPAPGPSKASASRRSQPLSARPPGARWST